MSHHLRSCVCTVAFVFVHSRAHNITYSDSCNVSVSESMGGCLALLLGLYYQSQQTAHGFTTPSAPNGKSPHEAKRLVDDKANSHKVGASGVEATTKADQWIVSRAFVGVAGVAPAIDNTLVTPNIAVVALFLHGAILTVVCRSRTVLFPACFGTALSRSVPKSNWIPSKPLSLTWSSGTLRLPRQDWQTRSCRLRWAPHLNCDESCRREVI